MDTTIQRKINFVGDIITADPEIVEGSSILLTWGNYNDDVTDDEHKNMINDDDSFELFKDWATIKLIHTIQINNNFHKFCVYMKNESMNAIIIKILKEYPIDDIQTTLDVLKYMTSNASDTNSTLIISAPAGQNVEALKEKYKEHSITVINLYTHDIMLIRNIHAMHGDEFFNSLNLYPVFTQLELFICLYIAE